MLTSFPQKTRIMRIIRLSARELLRRPMEFRSRRREEPARTAEGCCPAIDGGQEMTSRKWENEDGIEFDPTGAIKNYVAYRMPGDSALFSRRCGCGRMLSPAEHAMYNEDGFNAKGTCAKCGVVDLAFLCWESDSRG